LIGRIGGLDALPEPQHGSRPVRVVTEEDIVLAVLLPVPRRRLLDQSLRYTDTARIESERDHLDVPGEEPVEHRLGHRIELGHHVRLVVDGQDGLILGAESLDLLVEARHLPRHDDRQLDRKEDGAGDCQGHEEVDESAVDLHQSIEQAHQPPPPCRACPR
jgi:hypothetical protein